MTLFPSNIKFGLLFLLSLLTFFGASGQELAGKVVDADNGQSLPFVSILVKNSSGGTLTDIDGKFKLNATTADAVLQVSYLGYKPLTVSVKEIKDPANALIRLKPDPVQLNAITVIAGENPAHRIIKKATKNRDQNNPEKMHSFTYNSYNKFFVTADMTANIDSISPDDTTMSGLVKFFKKQHLFLIESITERKFLFPNNNKETVKASRVSGFKNSPFALMATQMQSFSFYDDFISVIDQKYLNPLSEGSTKKYFFLLEDTLYSGADTVFVISFKPRKNKNFNALKGVLYINTNGYAIQNVIAEPERPDDHTLSIKVQQKYEFVEGKQWFPVQLNTDWVWKNASVSSKKDPTQRANMKAVSRSYIRDIELNPELKKRQFNEVEVEVDKNADNQDEAFWNKYRIDTLNNKEKRTYYKIDSLGKAENFDRKMQLIEALFTNRIPIGKISLDIDKILRANDYEALRLGAGLHTNQKFSKYFSVGAYAGYGFGDKAWKYGGDLLVNIYRKKELAFAASYEHDLVESAGNTYFENVRTLNSSELFRDVYVSRFDHIEKYQAGFSFRALKYLRANIFADHQQRYGNTQFGQINSDGITNLRDTFNFNELGLQLKFLYKEKFLQTLRSKISMGSDHPVLFVNVIKGFDQNYFGLPGDFDYWKVNFKIDAIRHFKTIGATQLQLCAGKIFGDVPYTLLYNNKGSLWGKFNVSAVNTFETMSLNEFVTSQYASLFINHNIGRFLKLRKKFNPEFELVHNMGIGTLQHPLSLYNIPVNSLDKVYMESGFRLLHLIKSGYTTFGVGAFYRYGAYQKPKPEDNLAVKLVLSFKF